MSVRCFFGPGVLLAQSQLHTTVMPAPSGVTAALDCGDCSGFCICCLGTPRWSSCFVANLGRLPKGAASVPIIPEDPRGTDFHCGGGPARGRFVQQMTGLGVCVCGSLAVVCGRAWGCEPSSLGCGSWLPWRLWKPRKAEPVPQRGCWSVGESGEDLGLGVHMS